MKKEIVIAAGIPLSAAERAPGFCFSRHLLRQLRKKCALQSGEWCYDHFRFRGDEQV